MDETKVVKEMFDGLYDIITGPGFYTVNSARNQQLKHGKHGKEKSSNLVSTKYYENVRNDIECSVQIDLTCEQNETGAYDLSDNKPLQSVHNGSDNSKSTRLHDENSKETAIDSSYNSKSDKSKHRSKLSLKRTSVEHVEGNYKDMRTCVGKISPKRIDINNKKTDQDYMNRVSESKTKNLLTNCDSSNHGNKKTSKDNKSLIQGKCDKHCIKPPDLVASTRRAKRKPSTKSESLSNPEESAKGISEKLNMSKETEEIVTHCDSMADQPPRLTFEPGAVRETICSVAVKDMKDVDAQSDVSTDSRASGYTSSRTTAGLLKRPPPKANKGIGFQKGPRGMSSQPTKKITKRKCKSDKEINPTPKKRKRLKDAPNRAIPNQVKTNERSKSLRCRKMLAESKKTTIEIPQTFQQTNAKCLRQKRNLKQPRKLKSDDKLTKGSKKKQTKNLKKTVTPCSSKIKIPTPESQKKRKPSRQKESKSSTKCKKNTISKGKSKKAVKKQKEGGPNKCFNSNKSQLNKQEKILAQHSQQMMVEECNIMSALCQLEDKAKTLQTHDLERILPMRDSDFEVKVKGYSHPGGVWRRLVQDN